MSTAAIDGRRRAMTVRRPHSRVAGPTTTPVLAVVPRSAPHD